MVVEREGEGLWLVEVVVLIWEREGVGVGKGG